MRIDPQISPFVPQSFRLAAHQSKDHAVRSSLSICEKRVTSPAHCDRYENCGDAPGAIRYAEYLEKQNQRKLTSADLPQPREQSPAQPANEQAQPTDTGLGPKLGDIPTDPHAARQEQRVKIAYQLMRYAPNGSLVDVVI